jgi:hypothetical protein
MAATMADPLNPAPQNWTEIPVTSYDWPLDRPPPSKAAFAEFLTSEFGITDPQTQSGLWHAIAFSAQWLIADEFKRPDNKALRQRMKQIEGYTDKLLEALTEPSGGPQGQGAPSEPGDVDYWLWRLLINSEPSAERKLHATRQHLIEFKRLLDASQVNLSAGGTGRRKDETLWTWVEHLSPIWEVYANRPVTVDYHEGAPITPYTIFMHHAVRVLDPERESKLPSVLDRYRTRQNRSKNRSTSSE